jgi:hypothetical protein
VSEFLINQRVIASGEIGVYVQPDSAGQYRVPGTQGFFRVNPDIARSALSDPTRMWVHLPSRGWACYFASENVKPLPGGQL